MLDRKYSLILVAIFLLGCTNKLANDSFEEVRTVQARDNKTLYRAFGDIFYVVKRNAAAQESSASGYAVGSAFLMDVYENESRKKLLLRGVISKNSDAGWSIKAANSNNEVLSDEQISRGCKGCHVASDDRIILGSYPTKSQ